MESTIPVIKDLLLIGGGHAHVHVLKMLGMNPLPGVRISLISKDIETPYSGMLPGYIAGEYTKEECHIDLGKLCSFSGPRLILAEACKLDLKNKLIHCHDGRPPISYDVCSIDIGISPAPLSASIECETFITPVKPISEFSSKWDTIMNKVLNLSDSDIVKLAIVGGGAGGVELCFAINKRLKDELRRRNKQDNQIQISIYSKSSSLLPSHNKNVQQIIHRIMYEKGINVITNADVKNVICSVKDGVNQNQIVTSDGEKYSFDEIISCTNAKAQDWLAESGLATTAEGFVIVKPTLESINSANIFACGDVCHLEDNPRPKAGVFAVRAGPPLLRNLKSRLLGEPLEEWVPQDQFLGIITTGDRYAVSSKGPLAVEGGHQWVLKDSIDREWMKGYQVLPDMSNMAPLDVDAKKANSILLEKIMGNVDDNEKVNDILKHSKMRCGGCGSKIGSQVLSRALKVVSQTIGSSTQYDGQTQLGGYRSEVIMGVGDDAAILTSPDSSKLTIQTIDYFRSFISDPYLFGKIAANHALSDLHAMNGDPISALALCVLPFGKEDKVENDLVQMIAGACSVLKKEGCSLVGGHSSEGLEIAMGLSVYGTVNKGDVLRKGPLAAGDLIILTKPIGTGVLMAADMRGKTKGFWLKEAFNSMTLSNRNASSILQKFNCSACTDVTGFGLIGHLLEMLKYQSSSSAVADDTCFSVPYADKLAAELYVSTIPYLPGAIDCLELGITSSLQSQNVRSSKAIANSGHDLNFPSYPLLFDPQTAGGLLATVSEENAHEVIKELHNAGYASSAIIGKVGRVNEFLDTKLGEAKNNSFEEILWLKF